MIKYSTHCSFPPQIMVSTSIVQVMNFRQWILLCVTLIPLYASFSPLSLQPLCSSLSHIITTSSRNPLYKWSIGHRAILDFAFSPCGHHLAVAGADGYMRVFNHHSMELTGIMRSVFAGFRSVCWSPDGKFIVTGGEADRLTVFSVEENAVVAVGEHGHHSYVNRVAFDPYMTAYGELPDAMDFSDDSEEEEDGRTPSHGRGLPREDSGPVTAYRIGSVGADTRVCLWDMKVDRLRKFPERRRKSDLRREKYIKKRSG